MLLSRRMTHCVRTLSRRSNVAGCEGKEYGIRMLLEAVYCLDANDLDMVQVSGREGAMLKEIMPRRKSLRENWLILVSRGRLLEDMSAAQQIVVSSLRKPIMWTNL